MPPASLQLRAAALLELRRRQRGESQRVEPPKPKFEPRQTLAEFFQESWEELEPSTPLVWGWHIEAICLHIQEIFFDWMRYKEDPNYVQRSHNLVINVPPGSAKSRVVSVCAPAWIWTYEPSFRMIFLSANPRVALRDSVLCRDLLTSEWYQHRFQPDWALRGDQNSKSSYWNTAGGFRNATGFGSRITGSRADGLFWDDPHDADEVNSESARYGVLERWDSAIRNRINDPRCSFRVGIMQRLHSEDLSGHVLKTGEWDHLCIPQEFEEQRPPTAIGWTDPRTEPGELMCPERFPHSFVETEKRELGSYGYAGQHQQRPVPKEGGVIKEAWIKTCDRPAKFKRWILSVDATFKETKSGSFVVIQAWGENTPDYVCFDQWRKRAGFVETRSAIAQIATKWTEIYGRPTAILIEDKANGAAIIDTLKGAIAGVIPVSPQGSKEARLEAVSPLFESGNVYVVNEPWTPAWIEELTQFPFAPNDDQADGASQALNWMRAQVASPWKLTSAY